LDWNSYFYPLLVSKTARQQIHDIIKPPGNFRLCKSVILLFAYCFLPAPYLCWQATFWTTTSIESLPDRILSQMSCRQGNPPHCASSSARQVLSFLVPFYYACRRSSHATVIDVFGYHPPCPHHTHGRPCLPSISAALNSLDPSISRAFRLN